MMAKAERVPVVEDDPTFCRIVQLNPSASAYLVEWLTGAGPRWN